MRRRSFLSVAGLGAVGAASAACGSSGTAAPAAPAASASGAAPSVFGGAGSSAPLPTGTGAALAGRGPFTYVTGKDATGFIPKQVAQWNKANPGQRCTFLQLSSAADSQRQSMVQNALAKSATYGVLSVDVVWTAEFAANGYILELDPTEFDLSNRLPATVTTAEYFGKLYCVPNSSDAGMLYSRTDLLESAGFSEPPTTWAELISAYDKAKEKKPGLQGYAGQFQKYEGLTCNFSEAVESAGGTVLDASDKPDVNTAAAATGLEFLTNGFKQGYIPKAALTYMEEDGRGAFQAGNLMYLRNWSYAYAILNATDGSSKVNGRFTLSPIPGLKGLGAPTLGGHNLAISTYCKNKQSAVDFAKFLASEEQQRANLSSTAGAPTIESLYSDPDLIRTHPFLPILKTAITNAKKRPEAVNYNDVTTAIEDAAYSALNGAVAPAAALTQLQRTLTSALAKQ